MGYPLTNQRTFQPLELVERVADTGWASVQAGDIRDLDFEVLSIAQALGPVVAGRGGRVLEVLRPQPPSESHANSLSAQHGEGAFPLHTDGAHTVIPPRYLVLACVEPGPVSVPTVLKRFDDLRLSAAEQSACEGATFLVRNGRRSFYSTIASAGRYFIRYDGGCMQPINEEAQDAWQTVSAKAESSEAEDFLWEAGRILVIDNWRVLHGRGRGGQHASPERCLLRVAVQ